MGRKENLSKSIKCSWMKPESGILKVSKPLDCSMIPRKGSFPALVKALAVFSIIKLTNHRQKEIAPTDGTKLSNNTKWGNLQRLCKKAILKVLVAAFPAGNSLTLVTSLNWTGCFTCNAGALCEKIKKSLKNWEGKTLTRVKESHFGWNCGNFWICQELLPAHPCTFVSAWESSPAHPQISTSFLFVSGTSQH